MYLFHLMLILLVVILGGASRKRNVTLLTFEKPFLSVFGPHVHQKASSISFKISTLSALPLSFTVPSKLASMSFRVYSQSACVETEIFVTNTTQYYIQRFIILIFIINSSFQLSFENLQNLETSQPVNLGAVPEDLADLHTTWETGAG